jgi:hypothetical protein
MLGRCALVASLAAALAPACSIGNGTGTCTGELNVSNCWSGHFDLHPNFFAANPESNSPALQIRIQNGGDYESFSDGLTITVLDLHQVRGDPAPSGAPQPSLLGQPLVVTLPPSVVPPGVPVTPVVNPSIVQAVLYLNRTCRTQNLALYAVNAVSGVNPDGSCGGAAAAAPPTVCPPVATGDAGADAAASDAGVSVVADAAVASEAGTSAEAGAAAGSIGQSTITFNSLFDGDPSESNAAQRLTDATFNLYLADPREICSGGFGPPPPCRAHLTGNFRFYFQRGRPAQPFP